jgi:hypothetical protein
MTALRFYVYALIDPRDGEVFYVGKGCGSRASDLASLNQISNLLHTADALR